MVELVDAIDSKSIVLLDVPVQVGPGAPISFLNLTYFKVIYLIMDFYTVLKAIFLGIIEGITEFLPVSSTGHLIVTAKLLEFHEIPSQMFEIVIQLGAILAVCIVYRKKLLNVLFTLHKDKNSQNFTFNIILALLPAVIVGFFAHDFIKNILFSPKIVAISLIVGGIIMIFIDKITFIKKYEDIDTLPKHIAFKIGICQILAMIPGVSRSGSTIIGALLLGVTRKVSAEFSFFLAIPTIAGATFYDIAKNSSALNFDNLCLVLIGFTAAFISGLVVIKKFVTIIRNYGFSVFGYYRIILGMFIIYLLR